MHSLGNKIYRFFSAKSYNITYPTSLDYKALTGIRLFVTNLRPIKLTFIQHQISFGLPDSTSTNLRFLSINHPFFRLFYDGTRRPERRRVDLLRFKCFEVYLPKNSQF